MDHSQHGLAKTRARRPPPAAWAVIDGALAKLRDEGCVDVPSLDAATTVSVVRLDLADLREGDVIHRAKDAGWRFLARGGDAYADVREGRSGENLFAGLSRNANARRLGQAIRVAREATGDTANESEIRVVDVPALGVSAVWVDGPIQRFVPYADRERRRDANDDVCVDDGFVQGLLVRAASASDLG